MSAPRRGTSPSTRSCSSKMKSSASSPPRSSWASRSDARRPTRSEQEQGGEAEKDDEAEHVRRRGQERASADRDRQSVGQGKSVSDSVDLGSSRTNTKKIK